MISSALRLLFALAIHWWHVIVGKHPGTGFPSSQDFAWWLVGLACAGWFVSVAIFPPLAPMTISTAGLFVYLVITAGDRKDRRGMCAASMAAALVGMSQASVTLIAVQWEEGALPAAITFGWVVSASIRFVRRNWSPS